MKNSTILPGILAAGSVLALCGAPLLPAQGVSKRRAPAAAKMRKVTPQKRSVPSQEELIKRREKKLALEWIAKGGWITDYDKARALAKKTNRMIFTYFTRSYAP